MTIKTKADKPRILVADDDKIIRDLIKSFVRPYDFELLEAADGRQTLEAARAGQPDLILLDIQMPFLNGFTIAGMLKNDEALKHIPVIIITGMEQYEIDEHIAGLYDSYLKKPFNGLAITEAIRMFLANPGE